MLLAELLAEPEEQVDPPAAPARVRAGRWWAVLVSAGVVTGGALRLSFLAGDSGVFDADEAVVGLMARAALDGELTTFFWGQRYGGSLEALLSAPFVALLGPSPLGVRVVPMALSAVAAVLVWRLGRRIAGERAGVVAALAVWVWPANLVWFSTRARGFYWVVLVAGLALLLCALRLVDEPTRRRHAVLLGLLAGVAWWSSPQALYFLVPAGLWLLVRLGRSAWRLVPALPAAAVGAAPWWLHNLRDGWSSFEVADRANDEGLLGNAEVLVTEAVPVALGLRAGERWLVPGLFPLLYVVVLVVVLAVGIVVARRRRGTGLLVLAVLAYPPVYAAFPVSGVVGEGRYVLFILPFLALLLAAAAARRPWVAGALLAGMAVLSVATLPVVEGRASPYAPDREVPADLGPLLAALEADGVDAAIADYWVAYRITYESEGRIVAAALTNARHEPYQRAVVADDSPAWVFVRGSSLVEAFEGELAHRGVAAERLDVGGFTFFLPERRVVCWPPPPFRGAPCG